MNKSEQHLVDYLAHMFQAIDRIVRYTEELDETAFLQNELVQDAVMRNFEILGEASSNIQKHFPEFAQQHQELPLASASHMRNAIAHGYFKVDLEIVWTTIQGDLLMLQEQVRCILADTAKS